jgi:hypothetical protein
MLKAPHARLDVGKRTTSMEETKKTENYNAFKKMVIIPLLSSNIDEVQIFLSTQVNSFSMIKNVVLNNKHKTI